MGESPKSYRMTYSGRHVANCSIYMMLKTCEIYWPLPAIGWRNYPGIGQVSTVFELTINGESVFGGKAAERSTLKSSTIIRKGALND